MSVMSAGGAAVPLGGAGSEGFSVGSPRRPAEARRRFGADESDDLEERSEERFRARPSRTAVYGEGNPATRKGSHEVPHPERPRPLVREGEDDSGSVSEPRRPATPNPFSPRRLVLPSGRNGSVSAPAGGGGGSSSGGAKTAMIEGNAVLEEAGQRLAALKRRQAMELQHVLTFELRRLAKEEHDRQRGEKASAREAAADARRSEIMKAADRARLAQERSGQHKKEEVDRATAAILERQEDAARRIRAEADLRQRQSELAAQQRAEQVAERAAILDGRIARSVRVRRARQLRSERLAMKRAEEREAAADAAKRAREAQTEARKSTAATKAAAARNTLEDLRRKRESESEVTRTAAEERVAELEARAEAFRRRQKEIKERERVLRGEEAADATRQRRAAARRKVDGDARRRADNFEVKRQRERHLAEVVEIRRQEEAARRLEEKREREEQARKATERRLKTDEERREAARRKLEESAAKAELVRSEKERLYAARAQLSWETAKQRKALRGSFEALKEQSRGRISFDAIAAAVTAAATTDGTAVPSIISLAFGDGTTDGGGGGNDGSTTTLNLSRSLEAVEERALSEVRGNRDGDSGDGRIGEEELGRRRRRRRRSPRGDIPVRAQRPNQSRGARPATRAGFIARIDGGSGREVGGRKGGGHASWTDPDRALSPGLFASIGSSLSLPYSAGSATKLEGSVAEGGSSGGEDNNDDDDDDTNSQHGKGRFRATRQQENRTDLGPEWNGTFEAVLPQPASPPSRPAGASTPRRLKGGRKLCRTADLRKRYEIRGPSPPTTPGSRRGAKSRRNRGSEKLVGDTSRPRRSVTSSTRGATASRKARARHREENFGPNQSGGDSPARADRDGLGGGTGTGGMGMGGGAGTSTRPLASQDAVRVRYDRELLAVLEEEQAAEGARKTALAAAKARAQAAQARAGRDGGLSSERIPPAAGDRVGDDNQMPTTTAVVGPNKNQGSTTTDRQRVADGEPEQRLPEGSHGAEGQGGFPEGSHSIEGSGGLPEGGHSTEGAGGFQVGGHTMKGSGGLPEGGHNTEETRGQQEEGHSMEGVGVTDEISPADERNRTEKEVAVATAEVEAVRLERELARERRTASQRIMRVSGAYEDALRELAEQPYYAQGSTPNRPMSKGRSMSRNL